MKSSSWKNVHTELCIEVARQVDDDDHPVNPQVWMDMSHETPLPACLGAELARLYPEQYDKPDAWFEIIIEISCSGYYQPAKIWGRPEDCYPEDGEDEREVVGVTVCPEIERGYVDLAARSGDYKPNGKAASKAIEQALEGVYQDKINDMEIPADYD